MKHWKNLLVCLLAGVLALGVLTACSGLGSVNTGTDAEKAAELAQQLGVAHTQELDNTAKAVAEWFVQEPDSLRVSGLDLVYTVALDADGNMGYTDNLNHFLFCLFCQCNKTRLYCHADRKHQRQTLLYAISITHVGLPSLMLVSLY